MKQITDEQHSAIASLVKTVLTYRANVAEKEKQQETADEKYIRRMKEKYKLPNGLEFADGQLSQAIKSKKESDLSKLHIATASTTHNGHSHKLRKLEYTVS